MNYENEYAKKITVQLTEQAIQHGLIKIGVTAGVSANNVAEFMETLLKKLTQTS